MVTTTRGIGAGVDQLVAAGFVQFEGPFGSWEEARLVAESVAGWADLRSPLGRGMAALVAVGEFVIPPAGVPARDFQVLHLDFGLPIDPRTPRDVARYTALHVPRDRSAPSARTRIVPLAALLAQREWPRSQALTAQLVEYGSSRGARDGSGEYVEGILARLVEAADEGEPSLPSASECLCGQELDSLDDERVHFASRGLRLQEAEVLVDLQPGQLLVLDNLASAHGRIGRRQPKELHQFMLGYQQLGVDLQAELRDRILGAFSPAL